MGGDGGTLPGSAHDNYATANALLHDYQLAHSLPLDHWDEEESDLEIDAEEDKESSLPPTFCSPRRHSAPLTCHLAFTLGLHLCSTTGNN